jgi:site-specific recombinase XerD
MGEVEAAVAVGVTTIGDLIGSWQLSLTARNRAPKTIRSYLDSVRLLEEFLQQTGQSDDISKITRESVETFVADQLARWKPATASVRFKSIQQFFKWCVEERELAADPMVHMKPPSVPEVPVPIVKNETLTLLLQACAGKSFEAIRDTALLRIFIDTGCRLSEVANLKVDNVDLHAGEITVLGKGCRQRRVYPGAKGALALDRYIRERRRQQSKAPVRSRTDALWVGGQGAMSVSGLAQVLRRRCDQVGIPRLHWHQVRHSAAHAFLAAGGSEGDAMRIFGWRDRQMLGRYAASTADGRPRQTYKQLSPGDRV